jgi:NaMN:DMB phosphoribosyltransferase
VTTKAMIAAQDHGMVLVGNQPLLTMGESCPGGTPSPWKTNGWVLVDSVS